MTAPESPLRLVSRSQVPQPATARARAADAVHQHPELEILVFEHEAVTMLYGGRSLRVPPQRLVLFWGAMPHHALESDPRTVAHVLYLPVPMFLQWQLPDWFVRRLMNFDVLIEPARRHPSGDLAVLKHWHRLQLAG